MSNALNTIKKILKNDAQTKEEAILTVIKGLTAEDKKDLSKIFDTCLKSNLSKALYEMVNKQHYKPTPSQVNECLFKGFENVSMHYFRDQLLDSQSYDQNSFLQNIVKFKQNKTLEMIINRELPDIKQLSNKTKESILLSAILNDNADALKLLLSHKVLDNSPQLINYTLEQSTIHRAKNVFTFIINEQPIQMNKAQQINTAINSFDHSDTSYFDKILESKKFPEVNKWLSSNKIETNNMLESDIRMDMNEHLQLNRNKPKHTF